MAKNDPLGDKQLGIARHYAKKFGQPTDRASVLALARLVPEGFTGDRPQDKAWKFELFKGRTPTPKAVKKRLFFMKADKRRQPVHAKAAVLAAHLDYDRLGPQVAEWITHYVDAHGTGPLWSEVGAEWGWDPIHRHAILTAMHRAGWITSTLQPRSLRSAGRSPSGSVIPSQGHDTTTSEGQQASCSPSPPSARS